MRIISYILTLALGFVTGTFLFEQEPIEVESDIIAVDFEPTQPEIIIPALDSEIICLAKNIYFEARGESVFGKVAVASVTLNRVESPNFPDTICGVVYQAKLSQWHLEQGREVPLLNQCQFSWYCDGKSDEIYDHKTYESIYKLAELVYNMDIDVTDGATHYHADYVEPNWSKSMPMVAVVDTHIFYKMK